MLVSKIRNFEASNPISYLKPASQVKRIKKLNYVKYELQIKIMICFFVVTMSPVNYKQSSYDITCDQYLKEMK